MYVLQSSSTIDIDTLTVKEILSSYREYKGEYCDTPIEFLRSAKNDEYTADDTPVGDLRFVGLFLNKFCGVAKMNPIEIPVELQNYAVTKRNYSIVKGSEIPKSGRYFIKDVSNLKNFSYQGDVCYLIPCEVTGNESGKDLLVDSTLRILDDNLYQVSELVNFVSEYRCFIKGNKILGIHHYTGNPLIMLNEHMISELVSWVERYSFSKFAPKSYSMDVGVIDRNGDKQLALIEIHPVTSVGLYGFYSSSLPKMYKDGIDWYININRGVNECRIEK